MMSDLTKAEEKLSTHCSLTSNEIEEAKQKLQEVEGQLFLYQLFCEHRILIDSIEPRTTSSEGKICAVCQKFFEDEI